MMIMVGLGKSPAAVGICERDGHYVSGIREDSTFHAV